MNISLNSLSTSVFSCFTQNNAYQLKSTEEKMERIQKTQSQIDFFEGKKAELKDMHCNTLDEIAEKLALYNNYNDQIDAVKKQFNYEQMMHCMDEAEELGEKIAEAAEDLEPKTATRDARRLRRKRLAWKMKVSLMRCSMNCQRKHWKIHWRKRWRRYSKTASQ